MMSLIGMVTINNPLIQRHDDFSCQLTLLNNAFKKRSFIFVIKSPVIRDVQESVQY